MGTPFLGQITIFAFGITPQGWAQCNGQFLPINQNQALFSLLGTTYGGNGQTTFALPNLQGRVPLHFDNNGMGTSAGEAAHTLTISELPSHMHFVSGSEVQGTQDVAGITPNNTKAVGRAVVSLQGGSTTDAQIFGTGAVDRTMHPSTISNAGGSQAHENRQPFLTLNFCIALQGIFPSQN